MLRNKLQVLLHHQPKDVFAKYADYLASLDQRFEDKKVILEFATDSDELAFTEAQALDGALIHILRNCFDHGIESKKLRSIRGKNSTGLISLGVYHRQDTTELVIKDDGGGIDGDMLAKKAFDIGVWDHNRLASASLQDKVELIFLPKLSSKDEVSDISGRGVGMDAVKAHIEALGGSITISTVFGKGTTFRIKIPYDGSLLKFVV